MNNAGKVKIRITDRINILNNTIGFVIILLKNIFITSSGVKLFFIAAPTAVKTNNHKPICRYQ